MPTFILYIECALWNNNIRVDKKNVRCSAPPALSILSPKASCSKLKYFVILFICEARVF